MRNVSLFIAVLATLLFGHVADAGTARSQSALTVYGYPLRGLSLPQRTDDAVLFTVMVGSHTLGVCPAPSSRSPIDTSTMCWAEPALLGLAAAAAAPTLMFAPSEAVAASKRFYDESYYRDQARIYSSVIAGKGCELLLAQDVGLDKALAKAIGKICKNVQAGKNAWEVSTAVVTTYGAAKIAETLVETKIGLPIVAVVFTASKVAEYFSHTRILEALSPGSTSENHQLADFWAIRPAFKTIVTGFRYTGEKLVQQGWTDSLVPVFTDAIFRLSIISATKTSILAKGGSIGLSKLASTLVSQTIVTSSKMYVDGDFSTEKLLRDIATGAAFTLVLGAVVPTSLTVFTYRGIVVGFVLCTAATIGSII